VGRSSDRREVANAVIARTLIVDELFDKVKAMRIDMIARKNADGEFAMDLLISPSI
jgi:hypothetical protein